MLAGSVEGGAVIEEVGSVAGDAAVGFDGMVVAADPHAAIRNAKSATVACVHLATAQARFVLFFWVIGRAEG